MQSNSDPCIYYKGKDGDMVYMGVYVDDIVLAARTDEKLQQVKDDLAKQFDIKDLGKLQCFLGMSIIQDDSCESVWIGQPGYTENLLTKYCMQTCNPVNTPVQPGTKLRLANKTDESVDKQLYQSAIRNLMYLSVCTRPDITYIVSYLARLSANPTTDHWNAVKRVLRYLRRTTRLGIYYSSECRLVNGGGRICCTISCCTRITLAESTNLGTNYLWKSENNYSRRQSAIAMTHNPQFYRRSKHIDIKYHFVRDHDNSGNSNLVYCPGEIFWLQTCWQRVWVESTFVNSETIQE